MGTRAIVRTGALITMSLSSCRMGGVQGHQHGKVEIRIVDVGPIRTAAVAIAALALGIRLPWQGFGASVVVMRL